MKLDTLNGHNQTAIDLFNKSAERFSDSELLDIILRRWSDNQDLVAIALTLDEINHD
jgi:DNA repair protein RadC